MDCEDGLGVVTWFQFPFYALLSFGLPMLLLSPELHKEAGMAATLRFEQQSEGHARNWKGFWASVLLNPNP